MELKEIELSSGKKLRVAVAPFTDAKKLYQAIMREVGSIDMKASEEMDVNFIKKIICTLLSSKEIEDALMVCAKRSLYEDKKVTDECFEDVEARKDYFEILSYITWENVSPFLNGLFVKYEDKVKALLKGLASK